MKVVALISGGKDSCYNMMQCVSEGHEIVALANLKPKLKDEIDSYMFQTVGHQAIDMYAEAMNLPLHRRTIEGSSLEKGPYYECTEDDEVEDLFQLLSEVKDEHEIEGVSVGAILSDYQRVRVENVCQRLGLTSLAYLWRRDQEELLDEMIACGVEAIIVKVAAMGLDPNDHLGLTLEEIRPHMHDMCSEYGLNICGEGGEYETFTLNCPLFKQRIIVGEKEVVMHSEDAFAPVAYLNLSEMTLEAKDDADVPLEEKIADLPMKRSSDVISEILTEEELADLKDPPENELDVALKKLKNSTIMEGITAHGLLCLSGFVAAYKDSHDEDDLMKETAKAMDSMKSAVEDHDLSMADVVYVHLYVRDMKCFAVINSVYKEYFGINPPIRVCLETCLPSNLSLMLDCGVQQSDQRRTMHVQGLSHWAPANIGPYSQAVQIDEMVFVAGQIPLIPGSMQCAPNSLLPQARLSLRHVDRVLDAMAPSSSIVLAFCYITNQSFVKEADEQWKKRNRETASIPQVEYIVVSSLPRNSLIEWEVYAAITQQEHNSKHLVHTERCEGFVVACRYAKLCLQEGSEESDPKDIVSFVANIVSNSEPEPLEEKSDLSVLMDAAFRCIQNVIDKVGMSLKDGLRLLRVFYRVDMVPSPTDLQTAYLSECSNTFGNQWPASFMPAVGFRSNKCIISICM